MQMMMIVCMCTRVLRPFVVGKATRNAVTAGLIVEGFQILAYPPSIRDEWMTYGSHLSPLEKRSGAFHQGDWTMSFVASFRSRE